MKKILICILIIFIISCSSKNNKIDPYKDIIVNIGSDPNTMDPTLNSIGAVTTYILHNFEGLTKIDINNNIQPGIAEKWEISDDGLTYTFHLRTNAKWSDGKPVTANDFQYSWRRAADPSTRASYGYMMEIIKNAKKINIGLMDVTNLAAYVLDDYTLQVVLEAPSIYFLDFLSSSGIFMPLREDIIDEYGYKWAENIDTYICNGQYIIKERVTGEKIVMEENPYYYNKDEIVAKRITFISSANTADIRDKLLNGEVHFSSIEPYKDDVDYLMSKGYIVNNEAIGTDYLELNITNLALKNKMVRQALALAIDRNFISDNVLKGQIPAGAFVPPAIKGIKQSFRLESSNYIDLDNYENNIIKAKELMAKAGYKNGENYPTLEMKVSPGTFYELGKAIQTMWKDNLNVNVNLVEEEFPVTLIALTKKKYQIARMGWTGDYYDPMTMLDVMLSYGRVNHSGFSNAQYDSLISEAKTAYYNNLRIEYMKKAEAILMDEMPIIPLYYKSNYLMVNPKLKDFVINSIGRYRFNYCYIEK